MKKIFIFAIFLTVSLFFLISKIDAADTLYFDSTDKYLGACQLTSKSEWDLKEDVNVTKFQVWYNWGQGETSLPVKIFFNGEKFAEFEAKRADCDPYQRQWCNADFQINKLFAKGTYTTEIPTEKQCLKPGGTGAIRLYVDDGATKKVDPTPTTKLETKTEVVPTVIADNKSTGCSCNQTTIIVTAAVTSIVSSALVALMLRK